MLGCARCMGQINTEPNHCCYCDAPSLAKPLGDEIEALQKENAILKQEIKNLLYRLKTVGES